MSQGSLFAPVGGVPPATRPNPPTAPLSPPGDPLESDYGGDEGARFGGTGTAPLLGWGHLVRVVGADLVPPFPGAELIPPARVPPPPLLDGGDTVEEWVERLLQAYAGAVRSRYPRAGKRPFSRFHYAPGTPLYQRITPGAWALFTAEVAPAAWAAWTLDHWKVWASPREAKSPPPLPFVYARKRVEEHAGWHRREGLTYGGGRVVLGPLHRALVVRHHALMADVIRTGARTREELGALVARHFPGTAWADALAAARAEACQLQTALHAQARAGAWLW